MIAAMKQALEALEDEFYDDIKQTKLRASITALRNAIEQAEQAEPVTEKNWQAELAECEIQIANMQDELFAAKHDLHQCKERSRMYLSALRVDTDTPPRTPSDEEIDAAAVEVAKEINEDETADCGYVDNAQAVQVARRLVRRLFGKE